MALQLLVSNSLDNLYQHIARDLRAEHQSRDVFYRPVVVTQTEGINSWLRIRLAEGLGIAANYEFLSPNDLVAHIYFLFGGSRKPPLRTDQLQWLIFELLGTDDFIQKFPNIHRYFEDNDIKRLSLASKTADLFDQYQIYRTEFIRNWTLQQPDNNPNFGWQHYLWYQIQQRIASDFSDKTTMNDFILEALKNPDQTDKLQKRLPSVCFFGLAIITPSYLQVFHELSKFIDIRFYLINPAPEHYWMDTQTEKSIFLKRKKNLNQEIRDFDDHFEIGNDLLLNWGGIIRSGFSMLFKDENYINVYDESAALPFTESDTLLKKIQQEIYENASTPKRTSLTEADLKDGSITINSVYSPSREVEVLYNYLVGLVDSRKEQLAPRDIVVMVSDVETYAPFIRAVFENASYTFPYKIADESLISGNTIFSALHMILSLREDQLTVEPVLEILENKYVAAQFGITNPSLIRRVIRQSGIRFGIEGDAYNDTRYLSWQYGLKRIIYGGCISGEDLYNDGIDEFHPLDSFEGDDFLEMIRFQQYVDRLIYYIQQRSIPRTLIGWTAYLKQLVNELIFESGKKEDDDFHLLIQQMERLETTQELSNISISFEVFRSGFVDKLKEQKRSHSFLRGGITFCSYIPMRSIPFKVVCMLGLDFDKFPRKENPLSFSLFSNVLPGDRNVKDNDKHLFLENILSARNYLYLSYVGNSMKDATVIPPSALLDELIDYLLKKTDGDKKTLKDKLVTKHPLHGFSQQYFNGSGLVNYLGDDKFKSGKELLDPNVAQPELTIDKIELKALLRFFKNPVEYYFNKTLGIYFKEDKSTVDETEIFELDALKETIIKNQLLQMNPNELEAYIDEKIRKGLIPLSNMGKTTVEQLKNEVDFFKNGILSRTGTQESEFKDVSGAADSFSGKAGPIYGNYLVGFTFSSSKLKYWTQYYIQFVACRAVGLEVNFLFLIKGDDDIEAQIIQANELDSEDARQLMQQWLSDYRAGLQNLFCFYPEMKEMRDYVSADYAHFIHKIQELKNNEFKYDFQNEYLIKAYENGYFSENNFEQFKENTERMFQSLKI